MSVRYLNTTRKRLGDYLVELGFITQEAANEYVCLLTGWVYGNVQAALEYFREFRRCVKEAGMKQSLTDPCVFYKKDEKGQLILMVAMHVNDILITYFFTDINSISQSEVDLYYGFGWAGFGCVFFYNIAWKVRRESANRRKAFVDHQFTVGQLLVLS